MDSLLRAAGMFRYIHENFTNAPSMDLGPQMLDMLVNLMLVRPQAYKHTLSFLSVDNARPLETIFVKLFMKYNLFPVTSPRVPV